MRARRVPCTYRPSQTSSNDPIGFWICVTVLAVAAAVVTYAVVSGDWGRPEDPLGPSEPATYTPGETAAAAPQPAPFDPYNDGEISPAEAIELRAQFALQPAILELLDDDTLTRLAAAVCAAAPAQPSPTAKDDFAGLVSWVETTGAAFPELFEQVGRNDWDGLVLLAAYYSCQTEMARLSFFA